MKKHFCNVVIELTLFQLELKPDDSQMVYCCGVITYKVITETFLQDTNEFFSSYLNNSKSLIY